MDNNLARSTYKTILTWNNRNVNLITGFCFCKLTLDTLRANVSNYLHTQEQEYFETLAYPKRQQSYLLGRYCAKHSLSLYTQSDVLTKFSIKNGVFLQPIIYSPQPTDAQVSISHTDAYGAALAFSEAYPMGIDVEQICADQASTIQNQLTSAEKQKINMFPHNPALFFTLLWTVKEALSKVLKCGFTIPFEFFEIENIYLEESCVRCSFKNFQQYQALSFSAVNCVFSFVYPKNTMLTSDLRTIKTEIAKIGL